MKSRAIVSEKGQVTIPKRLRQRLGILPGTQLQFEERGGALVAAPLLPGDPLDALIGAGQKGDTKIVISEFRGGTGRGERTR
jgi:AbrB family looped-hinge helix DNA binding protein